MNTHALPWAIALLVVAMAPPCAGAERPFPAIPDGWNDLLLTSGDRLRYPRDWLVADAGINAMIDEMIAKQHPGITLPTTLIRVLTKEDATICLKNHSPPVMTLQRYQDATVDEAKQLFAGLGNGQTMTGCSKAVIFGMSAWVHTYRMAQEPLVEPMLTEVITLIGPKRSLDLIFTYPEAGEAKYLPIFEQVVGSIVIINK